MHGTSVRAQGTGIYQYTVVSAQCTVIVTLAVGRTIIFYLWGKLIEIEGGIANKFSFVNATPPFLYKKFS